jgi:glucokinase
MKRVLIADIGGTYARFAFAKDGVVGKTWSTEVATRHDIASAIRDFLAVDPDGVPVDGAIFAAAGPVEGGRCRLTNAAWVLDEEEIAGAFPFPWVRVVNDLEAVAAGLADLPLSQTRTIGPESGLAGAPLAIVSPGTGLGMACLLSGPGGRCVLTSEGGHASLASIDDETDRIIAVMRRHYGHVSAERALSGAGLVNLYQTIAGLDGNQVARLSPAEVSARAFEGSCPWSRAAVETFCAILGAVAGDVALTFGARGGVFIGGGIAPRFVDRLQRSAFRARFEGKGRLQPYMARIPVRVILHPHPAFVGMMSLVEDAGGTMRRPASR